MQPPPGANVPRLCCINNAHRRFSRPRAVRVARILLAVCLSPNLDALGTILGAGRNGHDQRKSRRCRQDDQYMYPLPEQRFFENPHLSSPYHARVPTQASFGAEQTPVLTQPRGPFTGIQETNNLAGPRCEAVNTRLQYSRVAEFASAFLKNV